MGFPLVPLDPPLVPLDPPLVPLDPPLVPLTPLDPPLVPLTPPVLDARLLVWLPVLEAGLPLVEEEDDDVESSAVVVGPHAAPTTDNARAMLNEIFFMLAPSECPGAAAAPADERDGSLPRAGGPCTWLWPRGGIVDASH